MYTYISADASGPFLRPLSEYGVAARTDLMKKKKEKKKNKKEREK